MDAIHSVTVAGSSFGGSTITLTQNNLALGAAIQVAGGHFITSFEVPANWIPAVYTIVAKDNEDYTASADFTLTKN